MTLSDLASLGSFVSGIAVLVSLIFLYFQLRQINSQIMQAEKNQRATLTQAVVNRAVDNNRWTIDSGIYLLASRAWSGETDFTADELTKLGTMLRIIVLNAQDTFLAHRTGLIDQMVLDTAMGMVRRYMTQRVWRALWTLNAQFFTPNFRVEIERVIAEQPIAKPMGDQVDLFRAALVEADLVKDA